MTREPDPSGGWGPENAELRVLVADDEPDMRRVVVEILTAQGIQVVGEAGDAQEAITMCRHHEPDVAIVDVRMGGGGGPTATKEILRSPGETRVVGLSAWPDRSLLLDMVRAGAVGYVLKEKAVDDLVPAVRQAAQGHAVVSPSVAGDLLEELGVRLQREDRNQTHRQVTLERIRRVLDEPETLRIEFQPIRRLVDGVVVGMEALSRFSVPPPRSPALWFSEAAEVGLTTELDLLAMRTAVGSLEGLPASAYLAVNLSPSTVGHPDFCAILGEITPGRLVIEVSETAPVERYRTFDEGVRSLRHRGGRLAVDDAGVGYSGLQRILRLAPEIIKLDMLVTRNIEADPARRALARALVAFGQEVGAEIIAEGIERAEQAEALRSLGIVFGQGYHLGRPAPLPRATHPSDPQQEGGRA